MTRSDYEVNPDDCNDGDDDYTREKVLFLHCRMLALLLSYSDEPRVPLCGLTSLFSLSIDVGYGGTRHLEDRLVGAANNKTRIAHRCDHADDAARSDHFI